MVFPFKSDVVLVDMFRRSPSRAGGPSQGSLACRRDSEWTAQDYEKLIDRRRIQKQKGERQ
jgi:hypothetical protein